MTATLRRRSRRAMLLGLALAIALPFAACEDDAPAENGGLATQSKGATATATATPDSASRTPKDVEDDVRAAFAAASGDDIDEFLKYWTDAGLQAEFETTRDELRAAPEDSLGDEVEVAAFRGTQVSGATATTDVDLEFEGAALSGRKLALVLEGDTWRIDNTQLANVAAPANARRVEVQMTEFQFILSPAVFTSGAPLEVVARNVGNQEHELVLVKAPEDLNLEEALQSEEEPEGLEFLGFVAAKPGEQFNFATTKDLEPGRYVLVCFFPDTTDPEQTPHALKGMTADFRVS